jgi:microsomal epoxide hydrolase
MKKLILQFAAVIMIAVHPEEVSAQARAQFARPELVKEFQVKVPQAKLAEIKRRLSAAQLPAQMPPPKGESNWQTGADMRWLDQLRQYWVSGYDWQKAESWLNSFPQYMADVDGYQVQFYYVKGETDDALPLVLTHGWPGSVVEFLNMIGPLTQPSKYGGQKQDAFTVIIPSLPGFGFSSMPKQPINGMTTARLWNKLVTQIIGHPKYVAQGGDMGAVITTHLGYLFPENVQAIHLNMFIWGTPIPEQSQTPEIKEWLRQTDESWQQQFDYARIQTNRPMMPAVALHDSPIGTAAWIADKFWAWSDNGGDLDAVINRDIVITDMMLYLLSEQGLAGTFWFYRSFTTELGGKFHPGYVKVPTAIAKFPKEFINARPPLAAAQFAYNVYRFTDMPGGGHFAALEKPELLTRDIREAFRSFRSKKP